MQEEAGKELFSCAAFFEQEYFGHMLKIFLTMICSVLLF